MLRRYSKATGFYLNHKKSFFDENAKLLSGALEQNERYGKQPERTHCKICGSKLNQTIDFTSHGIRYKFCGNCGHLNGVHEDTKSFIEEMYVADEGSDYSKYYIDDSFVKRSEDIYIPKLEFLNECVGKDDYTLLDVGCGSGHFVYAALKRGIQAKGMDVSRSMVEFGNNQISHHVGVTPLEYADENGFFEAIVDSSQAVISAIGVIEHLREPRRFFEAFQKSNADYLYYSVPMFSNTVFFELMNQDAFPRQLSGGHTHLFVENSIKKMNSLIGVEPIGEWRFGTDIMDMFRIMTNRFNNSEVSQTFMEIFEEGFGKNIDQLQTVFDQNHFCSEIHLVATKTT